MSNDSSNRETKDEISEILFFGLILIVLVFVAVVPILRFFWVLK